MRTIGNAGTYAKPMAWINAGPAAPSGAAEAAAGQITAAVGELAGHIRAAAAESA